MERREELLNELEYVRGDLLAFKKARDAIQSRINDLDNEPERQAFFLNWAATQAMFNVTTMAIVRCEGLLEDYRTLLDKCEVPSVVPFRRADDDG